MRLFSIIITLLLAAGTACATPNFKDSKKYRIESTLLTGGFVADGSARTDNTPLYYAQSGNAEYWYIKETTSGLFTISHAATGQYITFDGVYEGQGRRYVTFTDTPQGNESLWQFVQVADGVYAIRNAAHANHLWDVRVNSLVVGTYPRAEAPNTNQQFAFYDEQGTLVRERSIKDAIDISEWMDGQTSKLDGWDNQGEFFLNVGAGGSHTNGSASLVAPFIESWHATNLGPIGNCSLTQTIKGMPAGQYVLQADILAVRQADVWSGISEARGSGVTFFANNSATSVSTADALPERYQLTFTIAEGEDITLGLRTLNTNANWIAIDNIVLAFYGSEEQMVTAMEQKLREMMVNLFTQEEIEQQLSTANHDLDALLQLYKTIKMKPAIDPLQKATENLTIGGNAPAYVESNGLYLCPVEQDKLGTNYTATIAYSLKEGYSALAIDGITRLNGATHTFANIGNGHTHTLSLQKTDGTTEEHLLTFTSLPVVKIYGSFSDIYSEGYIRVYEPSKGMPEELCMKAKWRGGITNSEGKNKRNYHVKLKEPSGEKAERSFFGLRNDNSWILESCQVDMSRIRNRMLTDLWNDFSTPPYYIQSEPKAKTGTRGRFVELVLNDEYRGIYCMTENLDRKQMKLKKYDETNHQQRGQLWKSKDWSYAVFMGHNYDNNWYPMQSPAPYDDTSDMWDNYEVKYPDIEDVNPTDWQILWNAVNFVCTAPDDDFKAQVSERFDMPLLIDYYILMESILATDNHGKNLFLACYDKTQSAKLTFAVWDMDATMGQRWSDIYFHSDLMQPEQDYTQYIENNEHGDYNLFRRLRNTNADDFNMKVRLRYRDLRANWLDTESILNRFRTQLNEFKKAGSAQREYEKWNGNSDINGLSLDFDNEMEYIANWLTARMNYLDTYRFDIASLPTGINTPSADPLSIGVEHGSTVVIYATGTPAVNIYTAGGLLIRSLTLHDGRNTIDNLPPGVYIIAGRKVVVRR